MQALLLVVPVDFKRVDRLANCLVPEYFTHIVFEIYCALNRYARI